MPEAMVTVPAAHVRLAEPRTAATATARRGLLRRHHAEHDERHQRRRDEFEGDGHRSGAAIRLNQW
jgi:hypothetical protein